MNRVLLVDADPLRISVLDVGLRQSGYDVTTAGDGAEALEKIEWDAPDLVVTDTDLPVLNGFALVRALKKHPELAAVPVVFLASKPSKADEKHAIDLGAEGYLPRPVYVRDLAARIRLLLADRAREAAAAQLSPAGLGRLTGSTRDIALTDLLQDLHRARATGVVRLRSGAHEAHFFLRDGNVVDAGLGQVRGEDAVYRTLLWNEASFDVKLKPVPNEDVIHCTTPTLVMKGMERVDEWLRLCSCAEPLAAILDVSPTQLLTRLSGMGEVPERLKLMALPRASRDSRPKLPKAAPIVARPTASSPLRASESAHEEAAHEEAAHEIADPDLPTTTIAGSGTDMQSGIAPGDVILPPRDADEVEPPAVPERSPMPSSAPWTREAHPAGEPSADADLYAAGVPRAFGTWTKRTGGAVVGVAALLGVVVLLHSVRDRRMREAEHALAARAVAVAPVPSVVAPPAKPAAPPPSPIPPPIESVQSVPAEAPTPGLGLPKPLAEASGGVTGASQASAPAAAALPAIGKPEPATAPKDMGAAASPAAIASRPAVHEMFLESRLATTSHSPLVRDAQRLLLKGDTAHATEVAQKAVSSDPYDADVWLTLAAARLVAGDSAGAAEAYNACVAQARTVGVTDCRVLAQRLHE